MSIELDDNKVKNACQWINGQPTAMSKCTQKEYEAKDSRNAESLSLYTCNKSLIKCLECDYKINEKEENDQEYKNLEIKAVAAAEINQRSRDCEAVDEGREVNKVDPCGQSITEIIKIVYRCSRCKYQSKHRSHAKAHSLTHATFKLFRCSKCEYGANRKDRIQTHFKRIHKLKSSYDLDCSYVTTQDVDEAIEICFMKSINGVAVRVYKCSVCSYLTEEKLDADEHLTIHSDIQLGLYKSSEVDSGSTRGEILMQEHQRIKYSKILERCFKTIEKIEIKSDFGTRSTAKRTIIYKCSVCNYQTVMRYRAKRHSLTHSETKILKCFRCDYNTNRKADIEYHMAAIHGIQLNKFSTSDYNLTENAIDITTDVFGRNACRQSVTKRKRISEGKSHTRRRKLDHYATLLQNRSLCDYECNRKDQLKTCASNDHRINLKGNSKTTMFTSNKPPIHFPSKSRKELATNVFSSECSYQPDESQVEDYSLSQLPIKHEINIKYEPIEDYEDQVLSEGLKDEGIDQQNQTIDQDNIERSDVLIPKLEADSSCEKSESENKIFTSLRNSEYTIPFVEILKMGKQTHVPFNREFLHGIEHNIDKPSEPLSNLDNKTSSESSKLFYEKIFVDEARNYVWPQLSSPKKGLSCPYSNFETTLKDEVETHLAVHSDGSKMFKCTHCNYETKWQFDFELHLLIHPNQQFRCTECDFATCCKNAFRIHILNHLETLRMVLACI